MMKRNKIPAKLLIAGEFTVLIGGEALGIPFPKFFGEWTFRNMIDDRLISLFQYLVTKEIDFLNLDHFLEDIHKGLLFQSNIPEGYGLGGSGALSAAVLQGYALTRVEDIKIIQQQLAMIESCFHGTSSGFDPLISYTQSGCLLQNNEAHILNGTQKIHEKLANHLYLIDSNTERKTIIPIQWFYEQLKAGSFKYDINELNTMNNLFIQAILDKKISGITQIVQNISTIQYELFQPIIVPSMREIWGRGLQEGTHFCKLCGKGGGGFYYMWLETEDLPVFQLEFPDLKFVSIH